MIIDNTLTFAPEETPITASGVVGNVIDNKESGSAYNEVFALAKVNADFVGGTTLAINIETADKEDFLDVKTLLTGKVIAVADLLKDKILLKERLPFGIKRYMRAVAVADGTFSAGSVWITCALNVDKDANADEK